MTNLTEKQMAASSLLVTIMNLAGRIAMRDDYEAGTPERTAQALAAGLMTGKLMRADTTMAEGVEILRSMEWLPELLTSEKRQIVKLRNALEEGARLGEELYHELGLYAAQIASNRQFEIDNGNI